MYVNGRRCVLHTQGCEFESHHLQRGVGETEEWKGSRRERGMNKHNRVRDRHRRVRVDDLRVERAIRKTRVREGGFSKKKPRERESRRAMEERAGGRSKGMSVSRGVDSEKGEARERGKWAMGQLRKERPRDGSPSRVVNRCTRSGFARASRRVGLSRFLRREQCRWGRVPGVTKASW